MFTGNENHEISLEEASEMTATYRAANPDQILGHYLGRSIIEDILNQTDCVGIRIYYAENGEGEKELVLTGVDANGDDLYNGVLGDRTFKSPPYSGASNQLNS